MRRIDEKVRILGEWVSGVVGGEGWDRKDRGGEKKEVVGVGKYVGWRDRWGGGRSELPEGGDVGERW